MPKLNLSPPTQVVFGHAVSIAFCTSVLTASDVNAPLTKQEMKTLIKTAKTAEDDMKLARYYAWRAACTDFRG